jgi:murein DD-endopeptidase MepM/ murein hydrolase activator NlpD
MNRLQLFYPSKPFNCFQKFGESLACTEDRPGVSITKRKVSSKNPNGQCPIGFIELYPLLGMKGHTGLDLQARNGQTLYASTSGIVEEVQTEPERGLGVGIISQDRFYMDSYGTHYTKHRQWHLKSILVSKGQKVIVGQPIGTADSTGLSSGDHNHFELKPVELGPNGYYNVFQSNGFYGAIDPLPFFNGLYSEDIGNLLLVLLRRLLALIKK